MALTLFPNIKTLSVWKIDIGERLFPPTEKRVKELEAAIAADGQHTPIMVRAVTGDTFKVVAGAARLMALRNLERPTVDARLVTGLDIDYQIAELSENFDRHDLTREQRAEIAGKLADLRRQRETDAVRDVKPAKGGRGKKGGLSEAARQAGIPRSTAQRRKKPAHIGQSGQVSDGKEKPDSQVPAIASVAPAIVAEHEATDQCPECGEQIRCPECGEPINPAFVTCQIRLRELMISSLRKLDPGAFADLFRMVRTELDRMENFLGQQMPHLKRES